MMDEDGNLCFFVCLAIGALVGPIVGALISTRKSMYQDYQDDKYINGSIGGSVYAKNILGGAIIGAANGFATAMGGVAGLASLGMSVSGYSMSFGAAAALAIGVFGVAYAGEYSIQQIGSNDWNFKDAFLAGAKGLWKGTISFGFGYIGGRIGIMNGFDKTISNSFYSNVEMTTSRFITFTMQSLIGERKTKFLYSLIVGLIRWIL